MAQNNQNDNSLDMLWIAGIALVLFVIAKMWFGEDVAWLYTQMRWVWLKAITFVWEKDNLMQALRMIETRDVRELSSAQLSKLSSDLRFFMFPLWGGLVGWIGWKAVKKNPGQRFRRVLTRQQLAKEMSQDFPWILPALKKDLIQEPIEKGEWAMALPPLAFARKYGLLNGKAIDTKRAEKLFASQLGKLWNGPDRLNPYVKALFACFAAQVCRDKDGAHDALKELTISISAGSPVWTKSEELFKKYARDPRVEEICQRHAYQYTVMIALFFEGKSIGIFPPNHFLWLRTQNRPMWYALNCVMRRAYFAEVSGVYAHYLAEKVAGHRLEQPYIGKAVLALENAIQNIKFNPHEDDRKRTA